MPDLSGSADDYKAGRAKMKAGDLRGAIGLFQSSVDRYPHFKTLELLGECHIELGEYLAAIIPLAAALGLGSNAFRAAYLLATAMLGVGAKREASKFLDQAVRMNPNYRKALELKKSL